MVFIIFSTKINSDMIIVTNLIYWCLTGGLSSASDRISCFLNVSNYQTKRKKKLSGIQKKVIKYTEKKLSLHNIYKKKDTCR